jgi:hypothetical protein
MRESVKLSPNTTKSGITFHNISRTDFQNQVTSSFSASVSAPATPSQ